MNQRGRVSHSWLLLLLAALLAFASATPFGLGLSAGRAFGQDDELIQYLEQLRQLTTGGMPAQKQADLVLPALGQGMGLPPKRKVQIVEQDRSASRRTLEAILRRQYPGDRLEQMAKAFERIGLLPPGTDLRAAALRLYQSQVAGFYDPHTGRLVLVRGTSPLLQGQVLQHELAHSLQDQHYALQRTIDRVKSDEDRALAFQAILEGQAVVAMTVATPLSGGLLGGDAASDQAELKKLIESGVIEGFEGLDLDALFGQTGSPASTDNSTGQESFSLSSLMVPASQGSFTEAPPYLRAQLLFPYQEGTRFIETLMRQNSFPDVVRRTLRAPPVSTEQVIHPRTYLAGEVPRAIPLDGLRSLPGWRVVYETTLGELNIRTLLGGAGRGDAGAEGWGGDHLLAMEGAGRTLAVAWMTAWDSMVEAAEFHTQLLEVWSRRPGARQISRTRGEATFEYRGQRIRIRRQDIWVGLLSCGPNVPEETLMTALWKHREP